MQVAVKRLRGVIDAVAHETAYSLEGSHADGDGDGPVAAAAAAAEIISPAFRQVCADALVRTSPPVVPYIPLYLPVGRYTKDEQCLSAGI